MFSAVLEEENVYIAFDGKEIDVIHINKRKFVFFRIVLASGKRKMIFKLLQIYKRNFNPQTKV